MSQLRGNQLNIQDIADDPTMTSTFATGAHTHVEADITDLQTYLLTETDPVFLAQKGVANGVATLDAGGLILGSQLPAIAITNTFVVADEPAMLALTAQTGDVAIRTDLSKALILQGPSASTLTDWQELLTPASPVQSVDGLTGTVSLSGVYAPLVHTHLMADITDSTWISDITGQAINSLLDVVLTAPAANEVLTFDGTNWINQTSNKTLSELTDVTASPVVGELIHYNGAGWTNTTSMFYDAANAKLGIGTKFPNVSSGLIQTTGDIDVEGAYRFRKAADNTVPLVLYRGGTNFAILRDYADAYTIQQIWSPPGDVLTGGDREATLALVRGDEPNQEFMDVYNNGYASEKQFGIRLQKRGTGLFRDFVVDYDDGTTKTPVLRIQPDQSVTFSGAVTLAADPVGNLESSTKQYVDVADNLKVNKAGDTMSGDLSTTTDFIAQRLTVRDPSFPLGGVDFVWDNAGKFAYWNVKDDTGNSLGFSGFNASGEMYTNPTPTTATSVTNKTYVDVADNLKVNKTGDAMTGNLTFGDNNHIYLGIGLDLDIYHNGGNSVVKNSTGGIFIENATSATIAAFTQSATKLYFESSQKLETITTGVSVTGDLSVSQAPTLNSHATRKDYVDAKTAVAKKNYIINSTFSINQRAFAGGALADTIYGFDRWKAGGASDMTLSGVVLTIVSGTAVQVVEDFGYTGSVTVSWTGTSTVNGANTSPYTYTKVAGNDTLTFGVGTLSEVKLETGAVQTPFEYSDIGAELTKCQRYYEKSYSLAIAPGTNTGLADSIEDSTSENTAGQMIAMVRFRVSKRIAPAISTYDAVGNSGKITIDGTTDNITPGAVDNIGENGFKIFHTGVIRESFHWTADAEL